MPDLLVIVKLKKLATRLAHAFKEPCSDADAGSWLALRHPNEVEQCDDPFAFRFRCDPTLILDRCEIKDVAPYDPDVHGTE